MQECLSLNCKRNITHLFSLTFGLKNKINKNRISKMRKTFKLKLKQHLGIWQFWGLIYSLSKAWFTQSVCGIDNRIYSSQQTQSLINGSPTATGAKTSIWHSPYHHLRVSEIMHEKNDCVCILCEFQWLLHCVMCRKWWTTSCLLWLRSHDPSKIIL